MGLNPTTIEWVQNPDGSLGFTCNPFTGCLNGCSYCYARLEAFGRCKEKDMAGMPVAHTGSVEDLDPFAPRYHPSRLADIEKRKKPAGIFLCNRSDFFANYWPDPWQERVWDTVKACPQHIIYLLTKQPAQLHKFSPFPNHCRVGVTATNLDMLKEALSQLQRVEAKVKYLSLEPLLGRMREDGVGKFSERVFVEALRHYGRIDQIIIGAQSRPKVLPKWEWVKEIIEVSDHAGVPVFLKSNLGLPKYSEVGATPYYKKHPSGTMELRQEFPT